MEIKFKSKGSLLIAQSIDEFNKSGVKEGYVPSSNIVLKKEGLYINKNAPVYNTNKLAGGIECATLLNHGSGEIEIDVSGISHSIIRSSNRVDENYYGPIDIETELWTKESCISRYSFALLSTHIMDLIEQLSTLKNGEREKVQAEINNLKHAWIGAYQRDLLVMSMSDILFDYFDMQIRSKEEDKGSIDLCFELQTETKIITGLTKEHIIKNLKSEFSNSTTEDKNGIRKIIEENEAYEFYPLIDLK